MNSADVQDCVSIRVLGVRVGALGNKHSKAFYLGEASSEGKWVLAPVQMPVSIENFLNFYIPYTVPFNTWTSVLQ